MRLQTLHAYTVTPQKGEKETALPIGGAVAINAALRQSIDDNLKSANFPSRAQVDFDVDNTTRTNDVREMIIAFAFDEPATAKKAALNLAKRLAGAMDQRSSPCLFIVTAFGDGDQRAVTLWTFPRDEAFQLQGGRDGPSIQVLTDIFSQTSRLRKAARFEGRRLRNHFLSGRVLDFQATSTPRKVADFWRVRFLACRHSIAHDAGTRLLARSVREAFDQCDEPEDQEELYTAAMSIRRSPHKQISLLSFAERYLDPDGRAHYAFIKALPKENRNSVFDFRTDVFDETLQFRIFQLNSGVFVSSPLVEVGRSVTVTEGNGRYLRCEGSIVKERMRTKHA